MATAAADDAEEAEVAVVEETRVVVAEVDLEEDDVDDVVALWLEDARATELVELELVAAVTAPARTEETEEVVVLTAMGV